MKKSKNYKNYIELMEAVSEWNVNTCCYVLGRLAADYVGRNLTKDEWLDLAEKVPLSDEEKEKINF